MADVWIVLGLQNGEVMTCEPCTTFAAMVSKMCEDQEEIIMNNLDEDEEPDLDQATTDLIGAVTKATKNGTLPYAQFEDEILGGWVWEVYRRPLCRREAMSNPR